MSELTMTVHVSRLRVFVALWLIRVWKLGCLVTFHRPAVREQERMCNRLVSFAAGGLRIGRKKRRVRIVHA